MKLYPLPYYTSNWTSPTHIANGLEQLSASNASVNAQISSVYVPCFEHFLVIWVNLNTQQYRKSRDAYYKHYSVIVTIWSWTFNLTEWQNMTQLLSSTRGTILEYASAIFFTIQTKFDFWFDKCLHHKSYKVLIYLCSTTMSSSSTFYCQKYSDMM